MTSSESGHPTSQQRDMAAVVGLVFILAFWAGIVIGLILLVLSLLFPEFGNGFVEVFKNASR